MADALSDGITLLVNGIITFIGWLEILWTWLVDFIQLPFGLGPLGIYALPFNTFLLFMMFAFVGYKTKFSVAEINAILDSIDGYAEQGLSYIERVRVPSRKKRSHKHKKRSR